MTGLGDLIAEETHTCDTHPEEEACIQLKFGDKYRWMCSECVAQMEYEEQWEIEHECEDSAT